MKQNMMILWALCMALFLTACGTADQGAAPAPSLTAAQTQTPAATAPDESSAPSSGEDSRILIAYFTVPETDGVDAVASASRVVTEDGVVGNTAYIARAIQQAVGGDLFAIQTVQEYPGSHDALLDFAYGELRDNARPALATEIQDPARYDVIFLGYPNWNSDLPMPLYTFLESYDFSGKTIVPFVTHGGSGFSRTISTIQSLQPGATVVEDGLAVSRGSVADAFQEAMDWAAGLGLS